MKMKNKGNKMNMNHNNHHSMKNMKGMKGMSGMKMSGMSNMSDMNGMQMNSKGDMIMAMPGGGSMNMTGLKRKFWLSLILMIPILFLSPFMGVKLPFQITFTGSDWLVAILSSIMVFYCGQPFFSGAWGELKRHRPAMMALISMGVSVAYLYSLYAIIADDIFKVNPTVNNFFWELSTLIVIMLLGHWIEMNTLMNAGSAVDKLADLLPSKAHLIQNHGQTKDVDLAKLKPNDYVLIKAGEKIPADGVITKGHSSVNESLVTGEAKQVQKTVGKQVVGGSTNGDNTLTIKVTGTGKSSFISQIMSLVSDAKHHKSKQENMANRVSGYLFYAALAVAIIAFITWLFIHNVSFAVMMAVSALVIACPHALGLAVPLVVSRMTSLAATHGLLIRNRNALEGVKHIKYALMDKTGTLTQGQFKVNRVQSLSKHISNRQVLTILASLESNSSHPLASGITKLAHQQGLPYSPATNVKQLTGIGLSGQVNHHTYEIVAQKYLTQHHLTYNKRLATQLASQGNTVSYLLANHQVIGLVAEGDQIKPNSKKLVNYLKKRHIRPVMLTGDNQITAQKVARQLGINEFKAELMPTDKQKIVNQYQQKGHVLFIGDGINDAPSLAKANLGIAIGSGTDVAIDSADVVLVRSDPQDVISLLKLARKSNTKMTENLWWGAGYNIIAIPLAAGLLSSIGIVISPMVGAIIMSLSTIIVALNALSLRIN